MKPTIDEQRAHSSSPCRRPSRLRAALLAAVWMLPGISCAGHFLAHELESERHEFHAAAPAGDRLTGVSGDHNHGHSHPEFQPVISTEGAKKLDTSVLLSASVEPGSSMTTPQCPDDTPAGSATRGAAAGSGPRAPPIS